MRGEGREGCRVEMSDASQVVAVYVCACACVRERRGGGGCGGA